jgi:hypothetical protein
MPAPSRRVTILRVCAISFVALVALLYLFAGVLIGDPSPEDRPWDPTALDGPRNQTPVHLLWRVYAGEVGSRSQDIGALIFNLGSGEAVPTIVAPRSGWLSRDIATASERAIADLAKRGSAALPLEVERERDLEFVNGTEYAMKSDRGATLAREALRDLFCARSMDRLPGQGNGKMLCASVSLSPNGVYKLSGIHRLPAGAPPPAPDPDDQRWASSPEPSWELKVALEGEAWAGISYSYQSGPKSAYGYVGMMRRVGDRWILVSWDHTWEA